VRLDSLSFPRRRESKDTLCQNRMDGAHGSPPSRGRRYAQTGGEGWVCAALLLLAAFILTPLAHADSLMPDATYANTQLADPAKEREAKSLMETVRCLVCQGQSVADSDSDLAGDMRALIRKRIDAGEKPEAIRAWLVERYGDWITYDPPLSARTGVLWIAPILFLALGLFMARGRFARKKS
jgi:cytochrome c-type biogenesis protein CcmH